MSSTFSLLTLLVTVAVTPALALLDAGLSHDQLAGIRQQLKDTAHARYVLLFNPIISLFYTLSALRPHVLRISEAQCQALLYKAKGPFSPRLKQENHFTHHFFFKQLGIRNCFRGLLGD